LIKKILCLIKERRLPWLINHNLEIAINAFNYLKNKNSKVVEGNCNNISISFKCGFHGKTGGLYAIASIANMLAKKYAVYFATYPTSNYNSILDSTVKLVNKLPSDSSLYILDASCDHETYERIKQTGRPIIVSCHGLLNELHGLESDYVMKSLLMSDLTHFVNMVQQESFQLQYGKYAIIPNSTKRITKKIFTNNVGVVGNLDDERKNAKESVGIFLKSNASHIHLWSCNATKYSHERIICHSWESDKNKIFNSFDVLVFMSKKENCPMVVIESLSAGIPCLLSAIPAHEQFRQCPGVVLIDDTNRDNAHELLNEMLECKTELQDPIIKFWELNYSEEAVSRQWYDLIFRVCT